MDKKKKGEIRVSPGLWYRKRIKGFGRTYKGQGSGGKMERGVLNKANQEGRVDKLLDR